MYVSKSSKQTARCINDNIFYRSKFNETKMTLSLSHPRNAKGGLRKDELNSISVLSRFLTPVVYYDSKKKNLSLVIFYNHLKSKASVVLGEMAKRKEGRKCNRRVEHENFPY